jgi:hypothetical protein
LFIVKKAAEEDTKDVPVTPAAGSLDYMTLTEAEAANLTEEVTL